jgi:hypothetical protein
MTDAILHVSAVQPSSEDVHQILKEIRTYAIIINNFKGAKSCFYIWCLKH